MNCISRIAVLTVACAFIGASAAQAQATRTWVSGVGDDANPCSRTAPCKTFAGAISKTAAKGEISVLDPGGFGVVTITKSITINGDGTLAGILSSGTTGVIVNADPNDAVVLRNISINGADSGVYGIRYLKGGSLVVQNCSLTGFTTNAIDVNVTVGGGALVVENTSIQTAAGAGVRVFGSTVRVDVTLDHVSIKDTGKAVDSAYGNTTVNNSLIAQNSQFGVVATNSQVTVENSMLSGNSVAVQANAGGTVRLSNNAVYDNLTGFGCGGGTLSSAGNNRKGNNTGGGVPVCSPTTTITLQ